MSETLYEILELSPEASEIEIKRAFYEKAKLYHPDVSGLPQEGFQRVKHAYEILGNVSRRADYDRDIGVYRSFYKKDSNGDVINGTMQTHSNGGSVATQVARRNSSIVVRLFSGLKSRLKKKAKRSGSTSEAQANTVRASDWTFAADEQVDIPEGLLGASQVQAESFQPADLNRQENDKVLGTRVAVKVFSEENLPVDLNETFTLSRLPLAPGSNSQIDSLFTLLAEGFSSLPNIQRATILDLSYPDSSREPALLVTLERPVDAFWGVPNIETVELPRNHELLPEVLVMWLGNGTFSESLSKLGTEIYRADTLN